MYEYLNLSIPRPPFSSQALPTPASSPPYPSRNTSANFPPHSNYQKCHKKARFIPEQFKLNI